MPVAPTLPDADLDLTRATRPESSDQGLTPALPDVCCKPVLLLGDLQADLLSHCPVPRLPVLRLARLSAVHHGLTPRARLQGDATSRRLRGATVGTHGWR